MKPKKVSLVLRDRQTKQVTNKWPSFSGITRCGQRSESESFVAKLAFYARPKKPRKSGNQWFLFFFGASNCRGKWMHRRLAQLLKANSEPSDMKTRSKHDCFVINSPGSRPCKALGSTAASGRWPNTRWICPPRRNIHPWPEMTKWKIIESTDF